MAEARGGKQAVDFVDASHFVLASFLGRVWCFVRLYVRTAAGRQRYNVSGALDAVTHELVTGIDTTYVTATTVCALLRKIADLGHSVPITLVRDNARYQKCALATGVAQALGIELLYLPSYSPNLRGYTALESCAKVLETQHLEDDSCLSRLFGPSHTPVISTTNNGKS